MDGRSIIHPFFRTEVTMFKRFIYSKKAAPYVFIAPFVLTVLIFWISPLCKAGIMSFQKILPGEVEYVGWKNYSKLLGDRIFLIAVKNSILYTAGVLVLLLPVPLLLANIVNSKLLHKTGIFKTVYFIPALTSVVVAGTVFRLAFGESSSAMMNRAIALFGMEPVKWLKERNFAFMALMILCCWRWIGVNMMYFLAGLQSIPEELYESASIDGAGAFRKFIHISVPLVKPTTVYVLTISVYAGLSMFLESYMLWKGNNSPNNIGLTIVGYLYRQGIEKNAMGYASAVGIILLLITMFVNVTQLTLSGTFRKGGK